MKRTPSTERKDKEGALKRTPSTEDKEKKGKEEEVKRVPSNEKKEGELKRVPSDLKKVPTPPLSSSSRVLMRLHLQLEDDSQPRKGKFSSFMSLYVPLAHFKGSSNVFLPSSLGLGKKKDQENNAEDEGSAGSFSSYEKQVLDVNTFEVTTP